MDKYFVLYTGCIPVKGALNHIICDLQREAYFPIPEALYELLTGMYNKPISYIKDSFNNEYNNEIDEYFDFLQKNDFGFYTTEKENFAKIKIDEYFESAFITNAIVDFDHQSNHNFKKIIKELSNLMCEALEMRFFKEISLTELSIYLNETADSTLRSIEIVLPYQTSITKEAILLVARENIRVKKITIHSAPFEELVETETVNCYFVRDRIVSETCCGVVSPWYFITETKSFIEAHHKNSCLNKKIGIDKFGNIKNCPSMSQVFGHINTDSLSAVIENKEFQTIWNITKDQIDICKDCEFRYICQDCRAYLKQDTNSLSKPLKCNYDPYTAQWN
jgi:SPASM domain peptide maturase of grasp-with-spasm system